MEKRDNSGALFTNDKREKETHPHYQGKAMIAGKENYVSMWIKEDKNGKKYFSLSFKPVQEQAKPQNRPSYGQEFDEFLNGL